MFITGPQIRAARGMLDWSVTQLGEKAGVGATTISAIERGKIDGSKEVLTRIYDSVTAAGLVFTKNGGVEPNKYQVITLEGRSGFAAFFDDVYEVAKGPEDPNILVTNVDEKLFMFWHGEHVPMHTKRMSALKINKVKCLVREGDTFQISDDYSEYRAIGDAIFSDVCLYIYGEKSAIIDFHAKEVTVTILQNPQATKAFRGLFETLWLSSKEIGK